MPAVQDQITASDLAQFTGTTKMFFDPLVKRIQYTDGIKYLRDNGANWLVVDTLLFIAESLAKEDFVTAILTVKDEKGVLSFTDGNDNELRQPTFYEYTDFPLPTLKMFYTDGVLMLASEY